MGAGDAAAAHHERRVDLEDPIGIVDGHRAGEHEVLGPVRRRIALMVRIVRPLPAGRSEARGEIAEAEIAAARDRRVDDHRNGHRDVRRQRAHDGERVGEVGRAVRGVGRAVGEDRLGDQRGRRQIGNALRIVGNAARPVHEGLRMDQRVDTRGAAARRPHAIGACATTVARHGVGTGVVTECPIGERVARDQRSRNGEGCYQGSVDTGQAQSRNPHGVLRSEEIQTCVPAQAGACQRCTLVDEGQDNSSVPNVRAIGSPPTTRPRIILAHPSDIHCDSSSPRGMGRLPVAVLERAG